MASLDSSPDSNQHAPPPAEPPQRGWTRLRLRVYQSPFASLGITLLTIATASFFYLIASIVSLLVGVSFLDEGVGLGPNSEQLNVAVLSRNRGFFAFTLLVPQFSLIIAPMIAALFFPGGLRKNLGCVRSHWPWWVMLAGAAAAPFVGILASTLCSFFVQESESLRQTAEIMRFHSRNEFLLPLLLLISVTPSLCEELLFRGFLQNRLAQWLPPWAAITAASIVFALFHIDPVHVIAVFPLGLWLGWLTFASRSLLPAMLAHFCNNAMSVWLTVRSDDSMLDMPELWIMMSIVTLGTCGAAIAIGYSALAANPEESKEVFPANR